MEYQLERRLRFKSDTEYRSLYSWAINEVDERGDQIGPDLIPWTWTLYFTATSCVVRDDIELSPRLQLWEQDQPAEPETSESRRIIVTLRPGDTARDHTEYSMFGTGRRISNFHLQISAITDPQKTVNCSAWGTSSYTTEINFRDETTDDLIVFYLQVPPEAFDRYATRVAEGSIDQLTIGVGGVDGFYAGWSPEITTGRIKVLTGGSEQRIDMTAADPAVKPPRLGHVADVRLYISRRLDFVARVDPIIYRTETIEKATEVGTVRYLPGAKAPDAQTAKLLGSMKRAMWFAVGLLALILVAVLVSR